MGSVVRLRPDLSPLPCRELSCPTIGQEENRILRLRHAVRLLSGDGKRYPRGFPSCWVRLCPCRSEKQRVDTMVSATQDLINQGISALIISPFKPDALGPIVEPAKEKQIPLVIDDIG